MRFLLKEAESQLAVARSGIVHNGAADAAAAAQLRDAQKAAARRACRAGRVGRGGLVRMGCVHFQTPRLFGTLLPGMYLIMPYSLSHSPERPPFTPPHTHKRIRRAREDADRAAAEAARHKAAASDMEKSLAAARSDARAACDREAAAARELAALKRQREEDVAGLTEELGRVRSKIRGAEQDLSALRAEQQVALVGNFCGAEPGVGARPARRVKVPGGLRGANLAVGGAGSVTPPPPTHHQPPWTPQARDEAAAGELSRALASAQGAHQSEVARLMSELQRYRQQVGAGVKGGEEAGQGLQRGPRARRFCRRSSREPWRAGAWDRCSCGTRSARPQPNVSHPPGMRRPRCRSCSCRRRPRARPQRPRRPPRPRAGASSRSSSGSRQARRRARGRRRRGCGRWSGACGRPGPTTTSMARGVLCRGAAIPEHITAAPIGNAPSWLPRWRRSHALLAAGRRGGMQLWCSGAVPQ
jgi:flagellar biosynthesis chaperone FliJ